MAKNKKKANIKLILGIIALVLAVILMVMPGGNDSNPPQEPAFGPSQTVENPSAQTPEKDDPDEDAEQPASLAEDGRYYSKEDVCEYLITYGHLPSNFLTKDEAEDLGWVSNKGNLWDVTDRMCIGGDRFGNREGLLPDKKGRIWYECDVNYEGGYRTAERIVYSNDGLIYYTDDHYESFTQLY